MNESCLLPGNDYPGLILLGASGTGKTLVGAVVAAQMGLPLVESVEVAQRLLEGEVGEGFNRDVELTHQVLNQAALEVLRMGGEGVGAVVTLSPSAPLDPDVHQAILDCKAAGVPVVALEAALDTLIGRTGLGAARPVQLGMPRAWFKGFLETLTRRYEELVDHWFETDRTEAAVLGVTIASAVQLDSSR